MEVHNPVVAQRPYNGQPPPRQTWQTPRLVRMGSVKELTRKVNWQGNKDGGTKLFKTRT